MRIQNYKFGSIVISGKTYNSDVVIFPDKVQDQWWRRSGHELHVEDLNDVFAFDPEVLIVGTGFYGLMRVLPETQQRLASIHCELVAEKTGEACREYNQRSTVQRVVAALHLSC